MCLANLSMGSEREAAFSGRMVYGRGSVQSLQSPILVPTDFSPASVEAFAYALRLGAELKADVRLFHALTELDPVGFGSEGESQEENAEEMTLAMEALHQLAASTSASLPCLIRRGRSPAEEIVEEARTGGAGSIVLGMCGQRPAHVGLGAVSGEVIQTASCDVFLVPHREDAPFSGAPTRRILVPIDFSSASRSLLAFGCALADVLQAQLDLVHVLEPLPHPVRWLDEAFVDLVPQIQERAGGALRALAADASSSPEKVGLYVERGKAASSIPRVAEALGTDLILLGPHAERPVFDKLLGSVAEGVARRALCPVLIARASAMPEEGLPRIDAHSYEATV